MTICKFFLEGRCKFGPLCKNEHPRDQGQQSQNSNRFGALQSGGFPRGGVDRYRPGDNRPPSLPYGLTRDSIKADCTVGPPDGERPVWPMSCYGPGKDAPRQLIEGPDYEISPEEVRVLYYLAQASGDPARIEQYRQNEQAAAAKAHLTGQEIAENPDRFIQLIIDAENQHPNRLDQVIKPSGPWQRPPGFANNTSSSFGSQKSTFGQQQPLQVNNSPFSGFGNQPQPQQQPSAFGAPSALVGGGSSAFGRPSLPGTNASPFSQSAQKPAFGAPSAMGNQTPAFGTPSQPQAKAFGQASTLGNSSSPFAAQKPANTFGFASGNTNAQQTTGSSMTANQQSSPFGNLNNQPQTTTFGQNSSLGQSQGPSPFGQSNNVPSTAQPQSSPFSQGVKPGSSSSNTFGSGFGSTAGFGSSAGTGSSFGIVSAQQNTTPFLQTHTAPTGASTVQTNGVSAAAPQQSQLQLGVGASISEYTTKSANGMLQTWKGNAVNYVRLPGESPGPAVPVFHNKNGKQQRIWFPDGPPANPNQDTEGLREAYEGSVGQALSKAYDFVTLNASFEHGIMPEVPPMNGWKRWDI